jgi:hypothetical protein
MTLFDGVDHYVVEDADQPGVGVVHARADGACDRDQVRVGSDPAVSSARERATAEPPGSRAKRSHDASR